MRLADIEPDLTQVAFQYFYWFSRFEFALKENGYLKSRNPGVAAEPGWRQFVADFHESFRLSAAARELIEMAPQQQVVGEFGLAWCPVDLKRSDSDLDRVVRVLKTIRNNLFHGGKHGAKDWDEPERTRRLLTVAIGVLNELARHAGLEADYSRYY